MERGNEHLWSRWGVQIELSSVVRRRCGHSWAGVGIVGTQGEDRGVGCGQGTQNLFTHPLGDDFCGCEMPRMCVELMLCAPFLLELVVTC